MIISYYAAKEFLRQKCQWCHHPAVLVGVGFAGAWLWSEILHGRLGG